MKILSLLVSLVVIDLEEMMGCVPVDTSHDAVLGKRGRIVVVPYPVVRLVALVRLVEGVVDGRDHEDDVGDKRGDAME